MPFIKEVIAREILDSRGNPTIATKVTLDNGFSGIGYCPSGLIPGKSEFGEIRDENERRYSGRGVLKAVEIVNTKIRNRLMGANASEISDIDYTMIELDGTENKANLGTNSIFSVSLATARAIAESQNLPLYKYLAAFMKTPAESMVMPIPFMNILNGGKLGIGTIDFQEYMIAPVKFPSFSESLRAGVEIFHALGKILENRNYQPLVGDEGGFSPPLFSNEQGMELLVMAIRDANYSVGEEIFIGINPAAGRLYDQGYYQLHRENLSLTAMQLADFYAKWTEKYPIISIEDPFDFKDWEDWQNITQRLGSGVEIIGGDIYSTNKALLERGIGLHASTGITIKPNQIGTITQTLEAITIAQKAGFKVVISHRSGETEDSFIADLSVACGNGCIKSGAPCRSERTAKYNRLLDIENENKGAIKFATWDTSKNSGVYHL